jgi:hypothetical protein
MTLEDKDLRCNSCKDWFVFTAGEQELLHSRGLDGLPRRCPPCQRRLGGAMPRSRDEMVSPSGSV